MGQQKLYDYDMCFLKVSDVPLLVHFVEFVLIDKGTQKDAYPEAPMASYPSTQ